MMDRLVSGGIETKLMELIENYLEKNLERIIEKILSRIITNKMSPSF
jgi:hypothetical protein